MIILNFINHTFNFQALLSPGGLELLLHLDLPDYISRCAIWEGLLKDSPVTGAMNTDLLSTTSEGYSCAEVRYNEFRK